MTEATTEDRQPTGIRPAPVRRVVRLPSGALQAMEPIEIGDLISIEEFKL